MGQEIVYCSECASRLLGTDFDKGKAFRIEHKSLCADCAKKLLGSLPEPPPPDPLKSSSQRIPAQKSTVESGSHARLRPLSDTTVRGGVAPPKKSSAPLIAAVIGGLVVLAVVVAVASSGGAPPPPQPKTTDTDSSSDPRDGEARALLEKALAYVQNNPGDLEGQLSRLQDAVFKVEGSGVASRAKSELEAARARVHETVTREVAAIEARVRPLLGRKETAAARAILEGERKRFVSRNWDVAVRRLMEEVELASPGPTTPPTPAAELWTVLDLQDLKSLRGTHLEKKAGGSVLASGESPQGDSFTFKARLPLKNVTAIRVEALPDPSLPGGGPGRAGNGNAVLGELRVEAGGRPLAFTGVSATHEQHEWPASAAIDGNPLTGWGFAYRYNAASEAVFHAREPFDGAELTITLEFQTIHPQHVLGHVRISATSAALPPPPPPRAIDAAYKGSVPVFLDTPGSGWINMSWSSTVDLKSAAVPPFEGTSIVSADLQRNGAGVYFGRPEGLPARGYVSFAVYRVDESSFPYGVSVYGDVEKPPTLGFSKLGLPPVRQWTRYVIPLNRFDLPSGKVRGVVIQGYYNKHPAPPLYLDAIQFLDGPAPAAETPPALAAYRARWSEAAALAAARDVDAAAKLLKELPAPSEAEVKKELDADLADLQLLRGLHEETRAILAKWPRGWNIAVDLLDAAGATRRIDEPVRRVDARGLELRSGEILEPGRILAPSLAEIFLARPKKAETDARAAAVLCAIEGFPDAAKRFHPGALKSGPAAGDEAEARRFYVEAEEEYRAYPTRVRALEKFALLLKSKGETPFLRRIKASIQARLDAPKEFVFSAADLQPRGSLQLRRHEKGEVAWTMPEDVEKSARKDHGVELEYSAEPGTEVRGWALVGGCCQETFTFHVQGTDVEGPDAENPATVVKCELDGAMTPVHPAGVAYLKKTHAAHGGKKETERFAWVALPPMKRAGPGTQAKLRILAEHQGFAVAAVLLSSVRKTPPKEAEVDDLLAARPFAEPETTEGGLRGTILREIWKDVNGDKVEELTNHPKFKGPPDLSHRVGGLDSWSMGDQYGTRFRGWLLPPVSGPYVFWLTSDDSSEFWLSTDDTPAAKQKLASLNGAVGHRDWGRASKSSPVPLVKGRRYYLEVLHKQGGGGEHVSVGWSLPDGTEEKPILGPRLVPWSSAAAARTAPQLDVPPAHTVGVPLPMSVGAPAVARIEIYNGNHRLGEARNGAFTWAQPTAGAHLLSARATDRSGRMSVSPAVLVVAGELFFQRGVDFNGPGGSIDDRPWSSGGGPPGYEGPDVELRPPTDAARARMIRSSVALREGAKAVVGVPNGKMLVYATLWQPFEAPPFDLAINGKTVLGGHRFAAVGEWARLGPWTVDVADGKIEISAPKGTPHLSGVEAWSGERPKPARRVNTERVGGQGGADFAEVGSDTGFLIGFRVSTVANYLQSLRGIYRSGEKTADGPHHGQTRAELREILAKPGYAVGGVRLKGGQRVAAFNVVFMKVTGEVLDPKDSYESGWIVGDATDSVLLGGDGYPVIGLFGRQGGDLDALGLIQFKP